MTRSHSELAFLSLAEAADLIKSGQLSPNVRVPSFSEKLGHAIKGLRIGIPRPLFQDNCDAEIRSSFDAAAAHMAALGAEVIDRDMLQQLETVDLFMLPSVGMLAAPIQSESPGLFLTGKDVSLYTALFNLTGFPALALPCGFSRAGLPIGFQLAGRPFDETTVFQAGYAYEQSAGWYKQHPAL